VYYLRYQINGRRVFEDVGKSSAEALDRKAEREKMLRDVSRGLVASPVSSPNPPQRFRIADEIDTYLENVKLMRPRTHSAYSCSLRFFQQSLKDEVEWVDQVGVPKLRNFAVWLKGNRDSDDRTISNRVGHVVTFPVSTLDAVIKNTEIGSSGRLGCSVSSRISLH
jgi:hypothetical protein